MKGQQVIAGDRVDRIFRFKPVAPKRFAKRKKPPLALFDVRCVVVALLHRHDDLLLLEREFVLLKARLGQHFTEDREAFIEVFCQQVQVDVALKALDARAELRREKGGPLVELRRSLRFDAAARKQVTHQASQAFLTLRIKVITGAQHDIDIDERQRAIGHEVGDHALVEHMPVRGRIGRLKGQLRVREFFGPVGDVGGDGVAGERQCDETGCP